MKKPSKNAPEAQWEAYRLWVRDQVRNWHPEDDRGGPDCYIPRFNGIKAEGIEGVDDTVGLPDLKKDDELDD